MAIGFGSLLKELYSGDDATSYQTPGTFTPEANALIVVTVAWGRSPISAAPTLSGGSLVWSALQDQVTFATIAAPASGLGWFWAVAPASPAAMFVTADFAGETQLGCSKQGFTKTGAHATNPPVPG